MFLLDSPFEGFGPIISKAIKQGTRDGKPVYYFDYKGEYYINNNLSVKLPQLNEIIVDVINESCSSTCCKRIDYTNHYRFLVTRQIGTDDPVRWEPDTRISLIHEREGRLYVWMPKVQELMLMFRELTNSPYGKQHVLCAKLLNEKLESSRDFSVHELINSSGLNVNGIYRAKFNDNISVSAFYSLLKQNFISEAMKSQDSHKFRRYLTVTALLNYIFSNASYEYISESCR